MELAIVLCVIFTALVFEYINGFHDTANSIATVVGTKVLTPRQAILLAAVTNLLGAFTGLAVAKTISTGLVEAAYVTNGVLICALLGAIVWNLITWWFAMPSSSTHALVGGLCGAVLAFALCKVQAHHMGPDNKPITSVWAALKWEEVKDKHVKTLVDPSPALLAALGDEAKRDGTHSLIVEGEEVMAVSFSGRVKKVEENIVKELAGIKHKVVLPMFTSPIVGFVGGFLLMGILYVVLRSWRPVTVNKVFGKLQLASSAYMGFSHGMNDATKCMGIITLALVTASNAGHLDGSWLHWMSTPEKPVAVVVNGISTWNEIPIISRAIGWLPNWLQFGYVPGPADLKNPPVPWWVVVTCALTMAAGTAAGGWKIIKTMGHKMVKLQPVHGFAAETTAATVLAITGTMGMPVSTTHAITTSIMGVGCAKRFSALKLGVVERIIWAWLMTVPCAGGVAFVLVYIVGKLGWLTV